MYLLCNYMVIYYYFNNNPYIYIHKHQHYKLLTYNINIRVFTRQFYNDITICYITKYNINR